MIRFLSCKQSRCQHNSVRLHLNLSKLFIWILMDYSKLLWKLSQTSSLFLTLLEHLASILHPILIAAISHISCWTTSKTILKSLNYIKIRSWNSRHRHTKKLTFSKKVSFVQHRRATKCILGVMMEPYLKWTAKTSKLKERCKMMSQFSL